jgi:hypothetical protein
MPADGLWLAGGVRSLVHMALSEINMSSHLYSARFTCQLAVTELNYVAAEQNVQPPPSSLGAMDLSQYMDEKVWSDMVIAHPNHWGLQTDQPDNISLHHSQSLNQLMTAAGGGPASENASIVSAKTGVKLESAEVEYGLSVDLNVRSRRVRDMVNIFRHEADTLPLEPSRRVSLASTASPFDPTHSNTVAQLTSELCSEAVRVESGHRGDSAEPPPTTTTPRMDGTELDTMASIVEYTRRHESLMAFYYMDEETGQMKVTEIYDMQPKGDDEKVPTLFTTASQPPNAIRRHSLHYGALQQFRSEEPPPVPGSSGQVVADGAMVMNSVTQSYNCDSGVETSTTRDACTSPIRASPAGPLSVARQPSVRTSR